MAAIAPASSAIFMITPPCTLPSALACSGTISWLREISEARALCAPSLVMILAMLRRLWPGVLRLGWAVLASARVSFRPHGFGRLLRDERRPTWAPEHGSSLLRHPRQLADLRSRAGAFSVRQGVRREGHHLQLGLWSQVAQAAGPRDRVLHLAPAARRLRADAGV